MNKYILITAYCLGESVCASCITAKDELDAIFKAYKHYGGSHLTNEEFAILIRNTSIERMQRLFQDCTGEVILYLGLKPDSDYIFDLFQIE